MRIVTTSIFIERSIKTHPNCDYSKFEYINNSTKSTIICNVPGHGEFLQCAANHNSNPPQGCPKCGSKKHDNHLEKLLYETPESYYWIGFLMADGHIDCKINRLTLTLSIKDKLHLDKFSEYVNVPNKTYTKFLYGKDRDICSLNTMDVKVISKIIEKFDFKTRKTYEPPNINIENNDLFLSFLIGFIDGDGCIRQVYKRNDFIISIKVHSSWKSNLTQWIQRLYVLANIQNLNIMSTNTNAARINAKGYANINIGHSKVIAYLKNKTIELNLPILNRKWDDVPLTYSTRYEDGKKTKDGIIEDLKNNIKPKIIKDKYGVGDPYISRLKRLYIKDSKISPTVPEMFDKIN